MPKQPTEHTTKALRRLKRIEPAFAKLIKHFGPPDLTRSRDAFSTLVCSVTAQQVSTAAARSIQGKLRERCPRKRLTPPALQALSPEELRACGLSGQKVKYVHGIAEAFAAGVLSNRKLRAMSDEEVVEATTALAGIGRWTAEMLLIFCLERPDVWPIDDLGIRKGVQWLKGLPEMPRDRKLLEAIGEPWRPHRTYAAWYLWRSLELKPKT